MSNIQIRAVISIKTVNLDDVDEVFIGTYEAIVIAKFTLKVGEHELNDCSIKSHEVDTYRCDRTKTRLVMLPFLF